MATELRTDGPHSPEYTREVGRVLAEAVRVLTVGHLACHGAPRTAGPR